MATSLELIPQGNFVVQKLLSWRKRLLAAMMALMIDPIDDVTGHLPVATESPIRLQFSSPERLHTVLLMKDLFDQWVILQTWSGKQETRGGRKPLPFGTLEAGLAALSSIAKTHRDRGLVQLEAI